MTRERLSKDKIFSLCSAIGNAFSGREIKQHFADYSVKRNLEIDFPSMKKGESKSNYSERLFRYLDGEEQAGLIVYLTQQNEALKEKEIVQKALYQLAETYGIITETVEEQKCLTEIEYLLADYPGSLDFWKKAMSHYQAFQYRESLDNARLCLELLLKSLLVNEKSLENQRKPLGGWLKEQGVPKEISNMIWERIDYYAASQNNHVKHKKIKELTKKLTEIEVCLIRDETYAIIKYLVNRAKEASYV
ncbi:hypothetical protein [Streptococcus cuniculipharyngis]|uniref:Uncharacterized protein n=1 Tax=Streptococcus cuniculipharyngis TaxID=1562651 RepID=A0A5C5SD69_9STRE|nr:hypothetical protein [Streptococcus cuniculipharyngis]TWS99037.1 hypothetical protein FRX57_02210 [Streptococcus cuniculipharyngis]